MLIKKNLEIINFIDRMLDDKLAIW